MAWRRNVSFYFVNIVRDKESLWKCFLSKEAEEGPPNASPASSLGPVGGRQTPRRRWVTEIL